MITILLTSGAAAVALVVAYFFAPKGWRTLTFNVLAGVLPLIILLLEYLGAVDWTKIVPEQYAAIITVVIAVANIVLRFLTTTPVGRKP